VGNFEKAEEEGKKSIELGPDNPYGYHNLANSYLLRNRTAEAEEVLNRVAARHRDINEYLALRLQIAFLRGDRKEMERLATAGESRVGAESWIFDMDGSMQAYYGHLHQARIKWQRALDVALATGQNEHAAQHVAGVAVRLLLLGYPAEAQAAADAALGYSRGRDVLAGVALTRAMLVDRRAEELIHELHRRFPEDTIVRFNYLPMLRGQLALNRRKPAEALEGLEAARPYELGWIGGGTSGFSGSLFPIYIRGKAFLALNRASDAATEFRKIIDHIGVVSNDPTLALIARLQLARALKLEGKKAEANEAYASFLKIWDQADPDIPILRETKAELAKSAR
jgi:tetratricopeptide (TPR) repeat protein